MNEHWEDYVIHLTKESYSKEAKSPGTKSNLSGIKCYLYLLDPVTQGSQRNLQVNHWDILMFLEQPD